MDFHIPACRLIPYGIDDWSLSDISMVAPEGDGVRIRSRIPCAVASPGQALRFNTQNFGSMPQDASTIGQMTFLSSHIISLCPVWNRPSRELLAAYFRLLPQLIDENRNLLSERLEPFAGLYKPEDWVFSAPVPFPRAHLFAPTETNFGDERDFVAVDIALYLTDRIVAFMTAGSTSSPRKARENRERLTRAGIHIAELTTADLAAPMEHVFRRVLTPEELCFWEGETLPSSPFRPRVLT